MKQRDWFFGAVFSALSLTTLSGDVNAQVSAFDLKEFPHPIFNMLSIDQVCGLVGPNENDYLRTLLQHALSDLEVEEQETEEIMSLAETGEFFTDFDCDSEEADSLEDYITSTYKEFESEFQSMLNGKQEAEGVTEGDETELAIAEIDSITRSYPTGKMKDFVGCWGGVIGFWPSQLCFVEDGDAIELVISSPDERLECRLEGLARRYEDQVIMYALPQNDECQSEKPLAFFQNRCAIAGELLECHGFVMENAKDTYTDEVFEFYVAGQFSFGRSPEVVEEYVRLVFENHTSQFPTGMIGNADGCQKTKEFFGSSALLCINAASDQATLEIELRDCILGGPARRIGEERILIQLEAEGGECDKGDITLMTHSCEEKSAGILECFSFGMKDGWTIAGENRNGNKVPYIGYVKYTR